MSVCKAISFSGRKVVSSPVLANIKAMQSAEASCKDWLGNEGTNLHVSKKGRNKFATQRRITFVPSQSFSTSLHLKISFFLIFNVTVPWQSEYLLKNLSGLLIASLELLFINLLFQNWSDQWASSQKICVCIYYHFYMSTNLLNIYRSYRILWGVLEI